MPKSKPEDGATSSAYGWLGCASGWGWMWWCWRERRWSSKKGAEGWWPISSSQPNRSSCCSAVTRWLPPAAPQTSPFIPLFHFTNKNPSFLLSADTGVQPMGWEGKAAAWLLLPDHQPAPISGWIQKQRGSSHPRAPLLCQGHTGSSEPDVKSSATSGSLFSLCFSLLFWSSSSQRYMQGLPKCSSPTRTPLRLQKRCPNLSRKPGAELCSGATCLLGGLWHRVPNFVVFWGIQEEKNRIPSFCNQRVRV